VTAAEASAFFLRRVDARGTLSTPEQKKFDAASEELRVALRKVVQRE
jgi:hypothetical protein